MYESKTNFHISFYDYGELMKIGLIFPRYKYPTGDPPLGLLYIASFLRANSSHKVDIIDTTFHKSRKEIIHILKTNSYDIIGIYADIVMIKQVFNIAELSKRIDPDISVIIGGPFATVLPSLTLKNEFVDAIVVGEGEKTILEIMEKNLNFKGIKGVWYKNKEKINHNQIRMPIKHLDVLPFPARDLIRMNEYIKNWHQMDSVSTNLRGTNMMMSRGCTYDCSFCQPTLKKIFGQKLRIRSPENVIEEMMILKEEYRINSIHFHDDTFILNKQWTNNLCKQIIDNSLDLFWSCNVRANLVTRELLKYMKKAGLAKIFVGIETANQYILDKIYNKKITIEQVKKTVKIAKELGIKIQGYFMIGAPTETIKQIKRTIIFAKNLDLDEATFSITTPLPGTYLYGIYKDSIKNEFELDYYKNYPFNDIEKEKITTFLKKRAYLEFYTHPKRILKIIKMSFNPFSIQKTLNKLRRF